MEHSVLVVIAFIMLAISLYAAKKNNDSAFIYSVYVALALFWWALMYCGLSWLVHDAVK